EPKNAKDHLWLGQVYWSVGKKEDAANEFSKACQLEPNSPEAWEAYLSFLSRTDQKKEAQKVLEELKEKLTVRRSQTMARCYVLLGDKKSAKDHFLEAKAERPGDRGLQAELAEFYMGYGESDKARSILEGLIHPEKSWDVSFAQKSA